MAIDLKEALQRMEQVLNHVQLSGKREYFREGLTAIKRELEAAHAEQERLRVLSRTGRGRKADADS